MDAADVRFQSNVLSKLAEAIPALMDEYACAFPDFRSGDVTWLEQLDPNDPETVMAVLLWQGQAMMEVLVQNREQLCKCVLIYPHRRN